MEVKKSTPLELDIEQDLLSSENKVLFSYVEVICNKRCTSLKYLIFKGNTPTNKENLDKTNTVVVRVYLKEVISINGS